PADRVPGRSGRSEFGHQPVSDPQDLHDQGAAEGRAEFRALQGAAGNHRRWRWRWSAAPWRHGQITFIPAAELATARIGCPDPGRCPSRVAWGGLDFGEDACDHPAPSHCVGEPSAPMTATFLADSRLVDEVAPSPNHGERRLTGRPDMLLLHYTGMPEADAARARLCEQASEVSAHDFVFADGRIVQLVPETRRAWHAGEACWAGDTDVNSRSIGIEIANPGHSWGYADFPEAQIAAVIALARDIVGRQPVPPHPAPGPPRVAPLRKPDPGQN